MFTERHETLNSTLLQHLVSAVSLSVITINLLFWIPILLLLALVQWLVPHPATRMFCHRVVDRIYRAAVWIDTNWLTRVLGLKLVVHGDSPADPNQALIVVSNHRSWFDILILQALIVTRGPVLKFLIKRELIFVPIVGWICLALNFPRLHRGRTGQTRARDYDSVAAATNALTETPSALMNFAEGTRYTAEKHEKQRFKYRYLLEPRVGGLKIMLDQLPETDILDVTLVYPKQNITFWQALNGHLKEIHLYLRHDNAAHVENPKAWLEARWREKDAVIASYRNPDLTATDLT